VLVTAKRVALLWEKANPLLALTAGIS